MIASVDSYVEKLKPLYTFGGMQNSAAALEGYLAVSS